VEDWFRENGLPIPSAGTSSFCRARTRLSDDFLDHLSELCESHAEARVEPWQLWRGLRAKAIDGTSFRLDDTEENQSEYPQPSGQAPGCGFPVMSVVGVLDLATGRLLDSTSGPDRRHDARGLYQLLDSFGEGDVAVADRGFCGFELLGLLRNRGTHSVMRMHQAREAKLDWRRGRRLLTGSSSGHCPRHAWSLRTGDGNTTRNVLTAALVWKLRKPMRWRPVKLRPPVGLRPPCVRSLTSRHSWSDTSTPIRTLPD